MWGVLNLLTNYIFVKVGLQALLGLRTELYAYLQSLSLKFHDARRSADSSFRVAYDSQAIQTIYNKGFTNIFGSVITLVGIFFIMLRLDWQLTLLSLGIVPLIVGAIYFFAYRIRTESTSIQEQESAVLAQAQEGLSAIRMVHAFGREDFEVSQFHQRAQQSLRANLRLTLTKVKSALVISTLMGVGHGRDVLPWHAARSRRHAHAWFAARLQRLSRDVVPTARSPHLHGLGDGRRDGGSAALLRGARS